MRETMEQDTLKKLRTTFQGKIITPEDTDYEQTRNVLIRNGSPSVILYPLSNEDVALGIAYAREQQLTLSVRGGGHSNAGFSTNDGGIIIDVSHFSDVAVIDAANHIVRIGAGAKWGDIAKTLDAHGLAISSGDTASVGAAGLVLGGGIGWMVREYGLSIDSLIGVVIVTADGVTHTVSATQEPDLFWAVRGGGGNFGIVTTLEFTAHPVQDIYFGSITYAADNTAGILRSWRDYMRQAPASLTTTAILTPANAYGANPAMLTIVCCWNGVDENEANNVLDPLRRLGKVLQDGVIKKHYYEALEPVRIPKNVHIEVNNMFSRDFSDDLIDLLTPATGLLFCQIRYIGNGSMNKIAADATAFAHRSSEVLIVAPKFFAQDASPAEIETGLSQWRTIAKQSDGAYSNFLSRTDESAVTQCYPETTYARLQQVKRTYDPTNIFNQNVNIKP